MAGSEKKVLCLRGVGLTRELFFLLNEGINRVGRGRENEIILDLSGVSRCHATVHAAGGRCEVQDLSSKNGTFVNGNKVTAASAKVGDVIAFGPAQFQLNHAPEEDSVVALAVPPEVRSAADTRRETTRSTTGTDDVLEVPAGWLGLLTRVVEVSQESGADKWKWTLEVLGSGLGVIGVAVWRWPQGGDAVLLGVWGGVPMGEVFLAAQEYLVQREREQPGLAREFFFTLEEPPPVCVAVKTQPDGSRFFLLCFGDFRGRAQAGALLMPSLRLLVASAATLQPPASSVRQKSRDTLRFPPGHVIGQSPAMQALYGELRQLASSNIPVLISGETGVGKEHIARILHLSSTRREGPFEAVNCAAIPTDLLEAELFGIAAGVATGVARREGKMALANGGVIFLDEIGDMSPALQAKLLRALQEKEVHPVGAKKPSKVDVRVLAATNRDLHDLLAEGRFRADLFFRIAGYSVRVPPLRERREDIPLLVSAFMERFALETEKPVAGITAKALNALCGALWPGNVRELEHAVRRLVCLCPPGQPISAALCPPELEKRSPAGDFEASGDSHDHRLNARLAALERQVLSETLARTGGNQTEAAKILGISRFGLRLKLERLNLLGFSAPGGKRGRPARRSSQLPQSPKKRRTQTRK